MKKIIYSLVIVQLGVNLIYAQVGIGTENPEAMLDVAGTLQVREETTLQAPLKLEYIQGQSETEITPDKIILIADLMDQDMVKGVSLESFTEALNIPTENTVNNSVYSAKLDSGISLLNIGILVGNWQPISFPIASKIVGNTALVNENGVYTVPSNGVYAISVYFRYGTGIQASLLGGTPSIGIIKRPNGNVTSANDLVLESRNFSGINLAALINITISEVEINTLYPLNQGDQIHFALNRGGVATLGLLETSSSSFFIYKVSDILEL